MRLFVLKVSTISKNKFLLTQIHENQFLIETNSDKVKIAGENEYAITYVDIDNGPLIHVHRDFLGRGIVSQIEIVEPNNNEFLMIKVTL